MTNSQRAPEGAPNYLRTTGMRAKRADWISLIEASYNLDGNEQQWLDALFDAAMPLLDRGMGRAAFTFRCTPTTFQIGSFASQSPKLIKAVALAGHAIASQQWLDLTYRSGHTAATASELIYPRMNKNTFIALTKGRSQDVFMTGGQSGTGLGVAFGLLLREHRQSTAIERKRWHQTAAHLGAGLRLRAVARELALDAAPVEAILDSGGKVHEARNCAADSFAQEALRSAVRRIDGARACTGRVDPDAAMQAWEGLVLGRWSLVDRFDTDGRRFVVAVKNAPEHADPRGLTVRERQVAEFVGFGHTTAQISYALGVSNSSITNCTARAQEKLGLSSRAELAAFFAQSGLRRKLAEVALAGEHLLIGAYPLIEERNIAPLTEAERDIVALVVAGSTNADIARRRGSSARTVASQLQSIFRKLRVRSRSDLAVRLQSGATT